MPESRLPLIRLFCTNAALGLFNERNAGRTTPEMERAALMLDEVLTLLDVAQLPTESTEGPSGCARQAHSFLSG